MGHSKFKTLILRANLEIEDLRNPFWMIEERTVKPDWTSAYWLIASKRLTTTRDFCVVLVRGYHLSDQRI